MSYLKKIDIHHWLSGQKDFIVEWNIAEIFAVQVRTLTFGLPVDLDLIKNTSTNFVQLSQLQT